MLGALNVKKLHSHQFLFPEKYNNGQIIPITLKHKEVGNGVDSYTS